jgi:hypothetical protein
MAGFKVTTEAKNATVAEISADGTMIVLVKGTNEWVCTPGDENKIGRPPMCFTKYEAHLPASSFKAWKSDPARRPFGSKAALAFMAQVLRSGQSRCEIFCIRHRH